MYCADLSKRDLREERLDHQLLMSANLAFAILPDNMTGANLIGADLTGARIALRCSTFKDVNIDQRNFKSIIYLLSLLKVQGTVPREHISRVIDDLLTQRENESELRWETLIRLLLPVEDYISLKAMARL